MACDPGVTPADGLGGVDEEGDAVDVGELAQGGAVELLAKGVLGLVEARGVDDDELRVGGVDDGAHAAARRLRDGARDGDLLTHTGVEQRGLAHRWASHECHEATPECHGISNLRGAGRPPRMLYELDGNAVGVAVAIALAIAAMPAAIVPNAAR